MNLNKFEKVVNKATKQKEKITKKTTVTNPKNGDMIYKTDISTGSKKLIKYKRTEDFNRDGSDSLIRKYNNKKYFKYRNNIIIVLKRRLEKHIIKNSEKRHIIETFFKIL